MGTQIESDATDDLAPRGCLQYFKEDAATFSSFNWNGGNGELINNNQYSVCIMDNDAYCDVALTANSMFELTRAVELAWTRSLLERTSIAEQPSTMPPTWQHGTSRALTKFPSSLTATTQEWRSALRSATSSSRAD